MTRTQKVLIFCGTLATVMMILVISGKLESTHASELIKLKQLANAYCSCRGGISELRVSTYENIPDSGFVECKNGDYRPDIEDLKYACAKEIK